MNISKAHWTTSGTNVRLSMPIAKVDVEKRIVSGFATLDNVDRQGDIVPTDASVKAFGKFRGNLREMHQQIAVGKVVSFKEDKYFDTESKKFYNGVYVSAYVSKGAQDTWEKVLDGTLTGFSIGGNINDAEDVYNEDLGKSIRVIKDYELYELSLVDNPANQYANVISIEKSQDKYGAEKKMLNGYLSKAEIENVFWCGEHDIVQLSADASSSCPRCDKGMQNIGFVESNDSDKVDVVKSILSAKKNEEKEVIKMAEETTEASVEEVEEAVEAPVEDAAAEESVEIVEEVAEETEKAVGEETSSEAEVDDTNVVKSEEVSEEPAVAEDAIEAVVVASVEATKAVADALASTINTLTDTVKSLNDKVESLQKTVAGVSEEVKEVKGNFNEFGKRVDLVENATAFRKSGDLGEIVQEPEMVQKSLWGGRFLTKSDLFN